jgi:hypothetical protein
LASHTKLDHIAASLNHKKPRRFARYKVSVAGHSHFLRLPELLKRDLFGLGPLANHRFGKLHDRRWLRAPLGDQLVILISFTFGLLDNVGRQVGPAAQTIENHPQLSSQLGIAAGLKNLHPTLLVEHNNRRLHFDFENLIAEGFEIAYDW